MQKKNQEGIKYKPDLIINVKSKVTCNEYNIAKTN